MTPLRWGPSEQARALGVCAALGVAVALATRQSALLVLVAPAVWSLLTSGRGDEATGVQVRSSTRRLRGREGEPLDVQVEVRLDPAPSAVEAELAVPAVFEGSVRARGRGGELQVTGTLDALRWGRHRLGPLRVTALSATGMRVGTADIALELDVLVLPRPEPVRTASAPRLLPNRLGEHVTRATGHGVEPIGVRVFAPGDPVRRINWRVSTRRQQLHTTVAAAERATDLVLVLDALSDVGAPPDSSQDRTVRTATGMAQRWLAERDTVGLVVLGGSLRWLTPATGSLQQQRIAESVLWAWIPPGDVEPDLTRVPRVVVPEGSVVVVLTPLLDERALQAVNALRRRARRVLVVDVLGDARPEPGPGESGQLASRLWALDRTALVERYRRSGIPVLQPAGGELDRLVALALRSQR